MEKQMKEFRQREKEMNMLFSEECDGGCPDELIKECIKCKIPKIKSDFKKGNRILKTCNSCRA